MGFQVFRRLFLVFVLVLAGCANPSITVMKAVHHGEVHPRHSKPSRFMFGNYCGLGTRDGTMRRKPVDRLDAICFRHDLCYRQGRNRYQCNQTFIRELDDLLAEPKLPPDMRRHALMAKSFAALPVMRFFPDGILLPRDQTALDGVYQGPEIRQ